MRKMLLALVLFAFAVPTWARDIATSFDSDLVTSVAITATLNTEKAASCEILANNKAGDTGSRTLNVSCLDPDLQQTMYEFDQVTVAQADYARVLIDPSNASTGSDTTKFQAEPCHGRMRVVLGALSGKDAALTVSCRK
jgi:hypothetical protein